MKKKFCVGLTYGDPSGVGPEILLKTLRNWKKSKFKLTPVVIGLKEILINSKNKIRKPTGFSGLHSYKCLYEAITLAKNRSLKAVITCPVSKLAINKAGIDFSGQTEEIAKICSINPNKVIMMFAAKDLKIALFTRHIPLKEVSFKLSKLKLKKFILLLNKELKKWFKIQKPKIAVLGLNPHSGEGGIFGDEERKIITPVIKELISRGFKIYGPLSPDATLAKAGQDYLRNYKQSYDAYVSFYHDQSLPMFKAVCGMTGVNVTLGLPFIRVSPDHGTAFDIAGTGRASNESLVSAIKLLEELLYTKTFRSGICL